MNASDRPLRVLRDQRLGVRGGTFERGNGGRRADVSQRDAHVAQKAAALNPLDRRSLKKRAKLRVIEREKIRERKIPDRIASGERAFVRLAREAVPRTG